jgi:hypothetical protein
VNEFIRANSWVKCFKTMGYLVLSSATNVKGLNFRMLLNKLNAKRVIRFSIKVDGF